MSNMKLKPFYLMLFGMMVLLLSSNFMTLKVTAQSTVVNAILFYSPSCPHCHTVIQEDLPPLLEKYGTQLNIIGINVSVMEGQKLYQSAIKRFNIPENMLGVPCLIVGETVLVGSVDIPEQFPQIIEAGLSQGGIPMPDIPGLSEALAGSQDTAPSGAQSGETQSSDQIASEQPDVSQSSSPSLESQPDQTSLEGQPSGSLEVDQLSMIDRFNLDPTGNLLAVLVLVAMVGSLGAVGVYGTRSGSQDLQPRVARFIPLLAAAGLAVSIYLSYIEITHTEAICGPVGDCNAVQQSPYARLFGVLPVGVLGLVGYSLIALVWLAYQLSREKRRDILILILWGMALVGVLFSVFLTYLEPFVIGATCAWCISSAALITLIFLAASAPARNAWREVSRRKLSS